MSKTLRKGSFTPAKFSPISQWIAMSSLTLQLTPEEFLVKSYLERAVNGNSPSLMSLRLVHRFAIETPELFCGAAVALLQSQQDSDALRFVAVKLLQQPALM